ncbi:hypothetical protein MPH47_07335 [Psychrobacillus psychrodurans]|uniref:hypothetical protein n=1 Tax=Psychrobacillus psychrodurans TaxID=126157 RepID=UPI001F4E635C|nr:hypothetical protein [Psychrobacillus psychrodurans]MCK1997037.1 hypothetical protein [Psychrobacillus psychrodurans]
MNYEQSRDAFYSTILEKMDDIQVFESTSPINNPEIYVLPEDVYIVEVDSREVTAIPNNNYQLGDIIFLRKAQTNFLYYVVKVKYFDNDFAHFEVIDAFEPATLLEELSSLSEGDIANEIN